MLTEDQFLNGFQPSLEYSSPNSMFSSGDLTAPRTVAFIDPNIANPAQVLVGVQADVKVLLDPTRDGVTQITETLQQFKNLSSIDIISHGSVAQLQLGSGFLNANSLGQYAATLEQWKAALAPDADILFFGCNVAEGSAGQAFVDRLSTLTGADIAASNDPTGAEGDWLLEYATGKIETTLPLSDDLIRGYQGQLATLFTNQTPQQPNFTDGTGSAGDYELGMEFRSAKAGKINAIRYYKSPSETGSHVGRIWSTSGQLLASVAFQNETGSGWQQQNLANSLSIAANTTYIVSVNTNTHYAITENGLSTTIKNGDLSAIADGSNGVFNFSPGLFPTNSWNNSNYFRDVDFTATTTNPNNTVGKVGISGTPTQKQTLTANVTDADGLSGVTINYQWQQLSGGTWSNISGATAKTLSLQQAQVGKQVRVNTTYTDVLGSSENILSSATAAIANVNDAGTVAITGTAAQNQTLTANVTDPDGLSGVTVNYQWQQLNGSTWSNITNATAKTFTLQAAQVGKQVRVRAIYTDALGSSENVLSPATDPVGDVSNNNAGKVILKGSATVGADLSQTVFDADGLTGVSFSYQWQRFVNNLWTNITGNIAQSKSLTLTTALLGLQVRVLVSYIDALGSSEKVTSSGVTIAAQNAIVVENKKTGTTAWKLSNVATNNEISGYGDATSVNKGQALKLKISLAQAGQYKLDVYRLGYYAGTGARLITSVTGLNGVNQGGPTMTNTSTRLVEYKWNTSYTLNTGTNWTTGLYLIKLTDSRTGKQNYVQFVLRDDNRPADLGFQDAINTAAAYNNLGGYSVYDFNSNGGQRAYQVSFDRPFQYNSSSSSEQFNNTLTWEYNMTRWLERQGYDVSYFTNVDVSTKPLQLYSQKTFLSVGHDEYWTMEQRNNVQTARDRGINLAFFSANTAYWQVRYNASSSGQANRVMTVYKDTSGIGTGSSIDPIASTNPKAATTLFRSPEVNRAENALLGVGYIGDWGSNNVYNGFDYVISNASDPYFANTGLKNGDKLRGLVGYEWDGLLNNGLAPAGLVVLSKSPVQSQGSLPPLPAGTNTTISNSVRYTAASGAKVFSTGSIQWVWGLDSDGVTNPRVDFRAKQIAVNVFADMGAKPQTPESGIVV